MTNNMDRMTSRNSKFFIDPRSKFGYSRNMNKIETAPFLEASKKILEFIESVGTSLTFLRYDANENITKLSNKFLEDQDKYRYIGDMILDDKSPGNEVTEALKWLRRDLHFVATLFELIVQDEQQFELLGDLIKKSYFISLRRGPYEWLGHQWLDVSSRHAPNRGQLMQIVSPNYRDEAEVLRQMKLFNNNLFKAVDCLQFFYAKHGLETIGHP